MQRLGVRNLLYYAPVAVLFWFAVLASGVHATIAGVVLGFVTPIRPFITKEAYSETALALVDDVQDATTNGDIDRSEAILGQIEEITAATEAPADRLIRLVHPWSSYVVLPLFALANAGVRLSTETIQQALTSAASTGIFVGLTAGKPLGIVLFAFLAVRLGLARQLAGVRWSQMVGVGLLGGIGFTVSLFISGLAFSDASVIASARISILAASVVAGLAGYLVLRIVSVQPQNAT
jgi:NhaA family Na+:H+ antiporter